MRSPLHRGDSMSKVVTVLGCDQGRDSYFITILQFITDRPNQINLILADTCGHHELLSVMDYHDVDLALIDNEPDRLASRDLSLASGSFDPWHPIAKYLQGIYNDRTHAGYRLMAADQKSFETDIKPNRVMHGSIEMPCLDINTSLFIDKLVAAFAEKEIRVTGKTHRKFIRHMTAVKRDLNSGKWLRPRDHDDDLFFSAVFALAARDLWMKAIAGDATNYESAGEAIGVEDLIESIF
jgi:hypothetical protein